MGAIHDLYGLHGPNSKFADFRWDAHSAQPDGAAALWNGVVASGARWLKLLYPDHSRSDAILASAHGMKVIVRAPGEGYVHHEDVLRIISEFAGMCDVIEVGNEPDTDPLSLWNHCWYLENVFDHCFVPAASAGITLCTPGWRAGLTLPTADDVGLALAERLRKVYRAFNAIGLHAYDVARLATPQVVGRLGSWAHDFSDRPREYHVTEAGIAARLLANYTDKVKSDFEKADRYYSFMSQLAINMPRVRSVCFFLFGGTDGFERFNNPGRYDPNGSSSYWLDLAAWAHLGKKVVF